MKLFKILLKEGKTVQIYCEKKELTKKVAQWAWMNRRTEDLFTVKTESGKKIQVDIFSEF